MCALHTGSHTITGAASLENLLSGNLLRFARHVLAQTGSVTITFNRYGLSTIIEPTSIPFGQEREPDPVDQRMIKQERVGRHLREDERALIRLSSESGSALALRYGISRQAISNIRNYRSKRQPKPAADK